MDIKITHQLTPIEPPSYLPPSLTADTLRRIREHFEHQILAAFGIPPGFFDPTPPVNAPDLCQSCGAYWACEHRPPESAGLEDVTDGPTLAQTQPYRRDQVPHPFFAKRIADTMDAWRVAWDGLAQ